MIDFQSLIKLKMNILNSLFYFNPILSIVFTSWLVAQLLKFIIGAVKGKVDFYYFVTTGGMPSGHSAIVSSLAMSVGLFEGFNSPMFGVSMALALIVMHDAVVIRGAAGRQAKALNILARDLHKDDQPEFGHFKTHLGHSPLQVFAGFLLGITMAFGMWYLLYV